MLFTALEQRRVPHVGLTTNDTVVACGTSPALAQAFTPQRVAAMEPHTRDIMRKLIDDIVAGGNECENAAVPCWRWRGWRCRVGADNEVSVGVDR